MVVNTSGMTVLKSHHYMEDSIRPWGQYFILEEGEKFKVKRI